MSLYIVSLCMLFVFLCRVFFTLSWMHASHFKVCPLHTTNTQNISLGMYTFVYTSHPCLLYITGVTPSLWALMGYDGMVIRFEGPDEMRAAWTQVLFTMHLRSARYP